MFIPLNARAAYLSEVNNSVWKRKFLHALAQPTCPVQWHSFSERTRSPPSTFLCFPKKLVEQSVSSYWFAFLRARQSLAKTCLLPFFTCTSTHIRGINFVIILNWIFCTLIEYCETVVFFIILFGICNCSYFSQFFFSNNNVILNFCSYNCCRSNYIQNTICISSWWEGHFLICSFFIFCIFFINNHALLYFWNRIVISCVGAVTFNKELNWYSSPDEKVIIIIYLFCNFTITGIFLILI